MKKITLLLLVQVFMVTAFAQKMAVPCCTVIAVIPGAPCCRVITVRDNTTGRTFEFTVDNSVAKNYIPGTALNVQPSLGIIKSVNGTISKYAISEPVNVQPCCGIISIEQSGLCCNLVSASLPNDERFSFSVPKTFAANLAIGQKISIQHFQPVDGDKFQPVDGDKFQPVDGYAIVQSGVGALSGIKKATYSFPILKPRSAPNNNQTGGYDLKKNKAQRHEVDSLLDNAYESMQIFARINSTDAELEVKVNGRVVGRYTQTSRVTLDGFFKRNAINVVSFKFSKETNANYVELSGKLPGSTDWIAVFNFNSKPGKTEEQFEVPFIGKTNKQPAGYNIKNGKAQSHEAAPVENGYESVQIFSRINNDEQMEVKVNGRLVGKYTQTVKVNLDDFLKRNEMNAIRFNFSTGSKESYVELSGKFPGDADFTPVYNFIPKAGKTEGKFEVPFTGKKK